MKAFLYLIISALLCFGSINLSAHGFRTVEPDRARIQVHTSSNAEGLYLYGGQLMWGYQTAYKVNVHYGLELSQVEHQIGYNYYENYLYFAPTIEFSLGNRVRPYINMGFDLVDWLESSRDDYDGHTDVHIEGGVRFRPMRHVTLSVAARSHNTVYHGFTTFAMLSMAIEF